MVQVTGLTSANELIGNFMKGRKVAQDIQRRSALEQLMPAALGGDQQALGSLAKVMPELAIGLQSKHRADSDRDRAYEQGVIESNRSHEFRIRQARESARRFQLQMAERRASRKATADYRNKSLALSAMPADLKTYKALQKSGEIPKGMKYLDFKKEMIAAKSSSKASPFQKKMDQKFATDAVEWMTGGRADVMKGVSQLNEALTRLESGEKNLTGPVLGRTPDWMKSFYNQDSVDTKELVTEVVQRNLRLILGAQFTEKEGDRLIARAYNDNLDEATNARRVRRLMTQIEAAAADKDSALEWVNKNGTLEGWKGRKWAAEDFDPRAGEAKGDSGWKELPGGIKVRKKN